MTFSNTHKETKTWSYSLQLQQCEMKTSSFGHELRDLCHCRLIEGETLLSQNVTYVL